MARPDDDPTLDELIARSESAQQKAADLMAQIQEILEAIADRKAREAQVGEGGIDDHRPS